MNLQAEDYYNVANALAGETTGLECDYREIQLTICREYGCSRRWVGDCLDDLTSTATPAPWASMAGGGGGKNEEADADMTALPP